VRNDDAFMLVLLLAIICVVSWQKMKLEVIYDGYTRKIENMFAIEDDDTLLMLIRNYEVEDIEFSEEGYPIVPRRL